MNSSYTEPQKPIGTVAELFAGVGGFRIGLSRAGWKTIFSNQWEPSTKAQHASDVYVARFGAEGHSNVDIATVECIPSVDLLVGGFPCQDYSVAKSLNSAKGLEGKKGVLWWEILRLVEDAKPRFIFLENVDRLLKSPSKQRGRDFAVMLRTLGDAGYVVEWRIASAADYGFPQRRIRVFILAQRLDSLGKTFQLDGQQWIEKTGILAEALPASISPGSYETLELNEDVAEISDFFGLGRKVSPFKNSGVYAAGTVHTATVKSAYEGKKSTLGDVLCDVAEVESAFWIDQQRIEEWEFLKGAKAITRVHKESGAEYTYAEGKMAFPDLLTNPSRTILTGEGGSTPSRFKHIIQVGKKYRRLTPIELERLNGFPDDWTATDHQGKSVSDAKRAFFMGNALVIGMVERVGLVLAERLHPPVKGRR